MVNCWSSQLTSDDLSRHLCTFNSGLGNFCFCDFQESDLLQYSQTLGSGPQASVLHDWTSVTSCILWVWFSIFFFQNLGKMHKKHARTSLIEPTNTSFVSFFFSEDFWLPRSWSTTTCRFVVGGAGGQDVVCVFLGMPSVKQILTNYVIIWWNNGIWWYLMVFVCLFFVCGCVFFGDTCSTLHIPTVKVMLFFLNNEHKHLGDGWTWHEAFNAPLPLSWTEYTDDEGRVYFFNQVFGAASKTFPRKI